MSIKIITGNEAAQAHIAHLRSGKDNVLPERVAARLRDVFGRDLSAQEAVEQIAADIRRKGDSAVKDYTKRIDGVELDRLFADADRIKAAYAAMSSELQDALHVSAERIRTFHIHEPRQAWLNWEQEGEIIPSNA